MRISATVVPAALAIATISFVWATVGSPSLAPDQKSNASSLPAPSSSAGSDDASIAGTVWTLPGRSLAAESNTSVLFEDVPEIQLDHANLEPFLEKRRIAAYRIVSVNSDVLRSIIRQSGEQPAFQVALLDGPPLTLISIGAIEHSAGWQTGIGTWSGRVEGDETSRASFVIGADGSVNGVVRSRSSGRVKIEPVKNTPHHAIWRFGGDVNRKID